jgi:aryl-alcohol dehydrogenase-like predicted oxidoreductase
VSALEKRRLGRTEMTVSVIGFGAGEIGYEQTAPEVVARLLGSALDRGLNLIDTAECYMASEELIGAAIGHRRDDYYLMSKCGHATDLPFPNWDPALIPISVESSLKRLRTDHLDVIHLHSCSLEVLRQGDVIAALQKVRDAGKTRYLGYSGDDDAAIFAIESGAFDTLMISVSIADQQPIEKVLPLAAKARIGVIAKRSIANAVWHNSARNPYWQIYRNRLQELDYDFLRGAARDGVECALRFALTTGIHTALVGSTTPEHFLEDIEIAVLGALSQDRFELIRERWKNIARADWIGQQ